MAREQIARIQTLLAENPGVKSAVVGNTTVTYEDLLKEYEYWKNLADREADGDRARSRSPQRILMRSSVIVRMATPNGRSEAPIR